MLVYEIIERFRNGELKENQVFVKYLNPRQGMRVAYVALRVGYEGESLIYSWYDRNRNIISNEWVIYRHNINSEGFKEVSDDWDRAWRTHEDNFY